TPICASEPGIKITIQSNDTHAASARISIPFDPRVAATTVLPAAWEVDQSVRLPLVISAPDFGQVLVSVDPKQRATARLLSNRTTMRVDLVVEVPNVPCEIWITPYLL